MRRLLATLLSVAAVLSGAAASTSTPATAAARRSAVPPNIVYIVMDDMRRDDLAWMPNVRKRIFWQGQNYRRNYAPTALCCPNRWTTLRGQYPSNTGLFSNTPPHGGFEGSKANDDSTLATWLDPTYRTLYVGKYLNGYEQADTYVPPGWDDWQGSVCTYFFTQPCTNHNGVIEDDGAIYNSDLYSNRAIQAINRSQDRAFPYFLHLAYVAPHHGTPHNDGDGGVSSPWVPPAFQGTYDGPRFVDTPSFDERFVGDKQGPVADLPPLSEETRQHLAIQTAQRRESLAATDVGIGRVLDKIDATGEPTYVIFTSDNGAMAGDHRFGLTKQQPYEAASRLPLGIRGPGIEPGTLYGGMTGSQDIAPSILRLAGATAPYELDGRNIIEPRVEVPGRAILLMARPGPIDPENGGSIMRVPEEDTGWTYRALVTERWKLIRWPHYDGWELYDLDADPDELLNLVEDPTYDAVEERLKARLTELWGCSGRACDG